MSGVPGMPLPAWAPELKPCGTLAAYRRHLRRGEPVDEACRQAVARVREDRAAAGWARPSRAARVHLATLSGPAKCGRRQVALSGDPDGVTCLNCLGSYSRVSLVPARPQAGERTRAA